MISYLINSSLNSSLILSFMYYKFLISDSFLIEDSPHLVLKSFTLNKIAKKEAFY